MNLFEMVGRNVRELRKAQRLTQPAVLERLLELGVSMEQASLSRKESGHRQITVEELVALAAALGVSPAELLLPREPVGTIEFSDVHSLSVTEVRSWVRGWQPLPGTTPPVRELVLLPDAEIEAEADRVAASLRRLESELAAARSEVMRARAHRTQVQSNPDLGFDAVWEDNCQKAQDRAARAEREYTRVQVEISRLEQEFEARVDTAISSGWIHPLDRPRYLNLRD